MRNNYTDTEGNQWPHIRPVGCHYLLYKDEKVVGGIEQFEYENYAVLCVAPRMLWK